GLAPMGADSGARHHHLADRRDRSGGATRGQHSPARRLARRDRRSLGRPLARMGDRIAPPAFNFAVLPNVGGEEPYWQIKRLAIERHQLAPEPAYQAIEVPRNSPVGFITAFFATITGFALIWHIWWLVAVGVAAAYAVFVWFAWRDVAEYEIPAEEVARI